MQVMKKNVIIMVCAGVALAYGCGGRTSSGSASGSETGSALTGNWLEVLPEDAGYFQGFSLGKDGKAGSIGTATLKYESWEILEDELQDGREGRKIVLRGKSVGNGQTLDFSDTLDVISASGGSLVLARPGSDGSMYRVEYRKSPVCINSAYRGTIPAADCPGIDVTLLLRDDGTFSLTYDYLERDSRFESQGRYLLKGDCLITLENGTDSAFYRIEDKSVRILDGQRQVITGELGDMYVLNVKEK